MSIGKEEPYRQLKPSWWRETGLRIRQVSSEAGAAPALLTAHFLTHGPGTLPTGLYHLALPSVAHYCGLQVAEVETAVELLETIHFSYYLSDEEHFFVRDLTGQQWGPELKHEDARRVGIAKLVDPFRESKLFHPYLMRWGKTHLPIEYFEEAKARLSNAKKAAEGASEGASRGPVRAARQAR